MKIILSLDGGGIRGIVPAAVLAYLEDRIQNMMGDNRLRIANLVDFVAGTSTGSIIGGLMIIPQTTKNNYVTTLYTMWEIVQMYFEFGGQVFRKNSFWYDAKTAWGLLGPRFPESNIEAPLLQYMNHYKLKDLLKPCMFSGYDIDKRKVIFYTNADEHQLYSDYYLKDIVRGSTSIPSIFPPAYFNEGVRINTIVDGGIFANNPALAAYIEVSKTIFKGDDRLKKRETQDILMISLGTGDYAKKSYSYKKTKRWGKAQWIVPALDIMATSHSEVTHYEMEKIFAATNSSQNYRRINPPIILGSTNALDASKDNLSKLLKDAQNYTKQNKEILDELAKQICNIKGIHNWADID